MLVQPLPRDVKKAVDLLRADLGRGWKVDDLARLCQIPRRTLEKHFRRFIGLAPLEFLQAERFDEARRRLLRAPPGTSVTQVAIGCGFNHLGRFALTYRHRHGENPSDTLRRRRVSPGNPVPVRLVAVAERPALAVLPFELTGPRADRAGQISDEIAATLHRTGWIRVVPPPAGRYHLRGRVADDGTGTLRIRMTLLDRSARRYIWADSSQCAVGDLFDSSDWFSNLAAGALRSVLRDAEIDQAASQDPTRLGAWGLCMRALPAILAADLATHAAPVELLERAIEIAPHDPVPISLAAWCHGLRAAHHFVDHPDIERGKSLQFASRGAALCAGEPLSNVMLAAAYSLTFDLTAAEAHARHALAVDGGSAWAWGRLAWVHAYRDEAEDAIECCQIARALAPSDPLGFLWSVGIAAAHLELGRHDRAIPWYRRALAEKPKAVWINRFLAPALALVGKKEEGQQSLSALLRTFPDLTITQVRMGLPHTAGTWDRFSDGLASLGMRYS
ncbi:MAG TPA: helix-turn-helix domain-containing protein [Stellaceae bacterium]|nr:helix-turn-helix domain-containing protein [Stellaceae bacterium]